MKPKKHLSWEQTRALKIFGTRSRVSDREMQRHMVSIETLKSLFRRQLIRKRYTPTGIVWELVTTKPRTP